MLKITEEHNGAKSYSGLSTDTLPVNSTAVGAVKVVHQGDDALIYNVSTNALEYWVFDEDNNVWRKA